MTHLKTFIVDDEPDAGQLLKNLLLNYEGIQIAQILTDSLKALDAAVAEQPDVIFLDIDMPELNGIDFLKQLNNHSPATKVVFVSAHREYALEAIHNYAFDFITKPVDRQELRRVVHRLISGAQAESNSSRPGSVLLKTAEGYHYISPWDVLFLEAEGNYTCICLKEGNSILSGVNLGRIFEQFPQQQFLRISRKHIVNKKYLTFLNFSKRQCTLSYNGKEYQMEVSLKLKDIKAQL